MHARLRVLLALVMAAWAGAWPMTATGKPDVERKGGQWELLAGGSACVPGTAKCRDDIGHTRPSFGGGASLGYRWQYVFLGAAYRLGFFRPDYDIVNAPRFQLAYQHSVFAVVRPILPVWRLDIGIDIGPGFSRQAFRLEGSRDRDYTQGFSFLLGPTVDIFVAKRVFLGAKVDMILNGHGQTCHRRGGTTTCTKTNRDDRAGVHQLLFGLHLGGTFL